MADWPPGRHRVQERLSGIHISKQSEGERNRPDGDRDHLDDPDEEEERQQNEPQGPFQTALWRKVVLQKPDHPDLLNRPDQPPGHEEKGHAERHVEVGVRRSQKRISHLFQSERNRPGFSKSNRTDTRNQSKPIGSKDKNKQASQSGERPSESYVYPRSPRR